MIHPLMLLFAALLALLSVRCAGAHGQVQSSDPPTSDPRIGVHKPSDDTRINSGAGPAEPLKSEKTEQH